MDFGRLLGIFGAALEKKEENAVVKVGVGRTNNGAVPLGEGLVVSLVEAIRHGLVGELGVFSFFKFFVKAESSGN